MKLNKNKKGQMGDMIFVLVTTTSIALTMLIGAFIYEEIKPGIIDSSIATANSTAAYNAFGVAFPMFDLSFFFIIIALIIGLLVSSLFIPSSPIFVVINLVGIVVLTYLGATFSNLYGSMLEQPGANTTMLAVATANYPITTFVMQYLPYIGVMLVLFASIIMYSKGRGEF